jgi:hypothetical protein
LPLLRPRRRIAERLDLDSLYDARNSGTVTPRFDRRADLFQFVSMFRSPQSPLPDTKEGPLGDQLNFSGEKVPEGQ